MSNKTKKTLGKGLLIQGGTLAVAGLIVRILGLLRSIPQQHIIGRTGNGYYGTAYQIYSMILILSGYSLPLIVSKLISQRISRGQYKNAYKVFTVARNFALIVGGISCLFVLIFADYIAGTVFSQPMSGMALRFLAPTLLIVTVLGVYRGYFQGLGTMIPTAVSQIVEQVVLIAAALIGAYYMYDFGLKYNALMVINPIGDDLSDKIVNDYAGSLGAAGATIGCFVGALVALIILFVLFVMNKKNMSSKVMLETGKSNEDSFTVFKLLLLTAFPVILSSVMYNAIGLIDQGIYNNYMDSLGDGIYKFLLPTMNKGTDIKAYYMGIYTGEYKKLINIPIALANAMVSAIVPALTMSVDNNDFATARNKIAQGIRITMIISIPASIGLLFFGKPIEAMIFKGDPSVGGKMFLIGSLTVVFYALSTLGNGILQGIGKLYVPVINSVISIAVHLGALYLMLVKMDMGIYAVVLSDLIYALVMCILNQLAIFKFIGYKQELIQTYIKPFICSLLMGGISFGIYCLIKLFAPENVACIIGIIIAILIYAVLIILIKGIRKNDFASIPYGKKIYNFLKKIGLYR